MHREKPDVSDSKIASCLEADFGLDTESIVFLPIGYDPDSAVYRVRAADQVSYFLKLTRSSIVPAHLQIPRALIERGISNVVAPLPAVHGRLWTTLDPYRLILYPYIHGDNAVNRDMSIQQWLDFGALLRDVHRSGIVTQFYGQIEVERFASPMIEQVRSEQRHIQKTAFTLAVQREFAHFWEQQAALIRHITDRTEQLGRGLRNESFDLVLCHGDVHAANVVLSDSAEIYIIDWDTPRIAPRERDLLFIIGSTIARPVSLREEELFFRAYGKTRVDWRAITYYRHERVLEELHAGARSVFLDAAASTAIRETDARFTMGLFEPGSLVQSALDADRGLRS